MKKSYNFLLSDERKISEEDLTEREKLYKFFNEQPIEFLAKLRHFQPQIGCLNACKICSKVANAKVEFWNEKRLRNVIAALKYSSINKGFKDEISLITFDRKENRNSVIFPYLDNDIGNYPYLYEFIKLVYSELGVRTRISTVGFSRNDKILCEMHKNIDYDLNEALDGVRLSFTPYEKGWECNERRFSKIDYVLDMANFLKIYKGYYNKTGSGSRRMCVELRYKPLVVIKSVNILTILNHLVIQTGNYMYISKDENIVLKESKILNALNQRIELTQKPEMFYSIHLYEEIINPIKGSKIAHKHILSDLDRYKLVKVYLMKNNDGYYYAINPSIEENGNFGINIYPKTENRNHSGYIITERFWLNAMFRYKATKNLCKTDNFSNATWQDVYNAIEFCQEDAVMYRMNHKIEKANYIENEIIPMIDSYASALQLAEYPASAFFDPNFTIDTGIICNLGRALSEFLGITSKENEPITPTHEINYGASNSTMVKDSVAWRLTCDYGNKVAIEKLNMYTTALEGGQLAERESINLKDGDEVYYSNDLENLYLIPGQRHI